MPTPYVSKLAQKHGLSVDEAEKRWNDAKQRAKDEGHEKDFAYITGIFKRMMHETSSMNIINALSRLRVVAQLEQKAGVVSDGDQRQFISDLQEMHPVFKQARESRTMDGKPCLEIVGGSAIKESMQAMEQHGWKKTGTWHRDGEFDDFPLYTLDGRWPVKIWLLAPHRIQIQAPEESAQPPDTFPALPDTQQNPQMPGLPGADAGAETLPDAPSNNPGVAVPPDANDAADGEDGEPDEDNDGIDSDGDGEDADPEEDNDNDELDPAVDADGTDVDEDNPESDDQSAIDGNDVDNSDDVGDEDDDSDGDEDDESAIPTKSGDVDPTSSDDDSEDDDSEDDDSEDEGSDEDDTDDEGDEGDSNTFPPSSDESDDGDDEDSDEDSEEDSDTDDDTDSDESDDGDTAPVPDKPAVDPKLQKDPDYKKYLELKKKFEGSGDDDSEDEDQQKDKSPPIIAEARLKEVASLANQAQAKRFLQSIGLQPTSVGKSEDNYISFRLARDADEQTIVNTISDALGRSGTKRAKDFGPQIHRITKTIQWVWEVPGKGVITFYPPTMKVAFMNRIEDDIVEAGRFVGTHEWFLGLDDAKQKDYLVKNPTSTFTRPERTAKAVQKNRGAKAAKTKRVNKMVESLENRVPTAAAARLKLLATHPLYQELRSQYGNLQMGKVDFQVYEHQGVVTVSWDLTFRRNTRVGAFKENQSQINRANQVLQKIADEFEESTKYTVVSLRLCTLKDAENGDKMADMNGDSAYSEYEQSLGAGIKIK